jgi:4-hydroxy-tetrahydrodipicolinate reductase
VSGAKKRVVAWGTGGLGRDGLKMIIQHPDLELVGAFTSSPDKVGRDAGELGRVEVRTGVPATDDRAALLALKPDCVAYFANSAGRDDGVLEDVLPFLESGVNVASISHFDLQHPKFGRPRYVRPIEAACRKGGASIYLTGDDPGWAFGHLLFSLLSVMGRIDRLDVGALACVRDYSGLESLRMYGFGEPLDFQPPMFTSQVGAAWHIDTLRAIADFLGVAVDEYRQEWRTAAMDFDFETTAYGRVRAGTTAAAYWIVTAMVGGRPFIVYHKLLRLHEDAAPDWLKSAGGTGRENAKILRVTGDPSVATEIVRTEGMSLTPVSAVSAIPWVCDAPPGILTQADVPLFPARNLSVPARR